MVAGLIGLPLAALGRGFKLLTGVGLLFGAWQIRNLTKMQPPIYQSLIATGDSQNVILTVPPKGEVKRHFYLIGHLDSNKQRFAFPYENRGQTKMRHTLDLMGSFLAGASLVLDALRDRPGLRWWQWLFTAAFAKTTVTMLKDEQQPFVEGANDNATAVAVLLTIAQALKTNPLENTQVTLLFTGCEEVGCMGMESYLNAYQPDRENSYWLDIEMVGTGNLCYTTRHGLTYLSEYEPHPEMLNITARAAAKNPDLYVVGRDLLMVEEVGSLARRGYKAVCLAGYDSEGFLPNWHRVSDTLDKIEPETLERAAQYTWAVMQELEA